MMDWATISALATGGGTLVLAVATFAAVHSANRAARSAERSLLAGLRPVLMPSRPQDPALEVGFMDGQWITVPGGRAAAKASTETVYFALALRNVGSGLAVLHGWSFYPARLVGPASSVNAAEFRRLSRDLYVPAGDTGFWQGTFRDRNEPGFADAHAAVTNRRPFTIDVLYGDHEGGQRVISRFTLTPTEGSESWLTAVSHHWDIDRPAHR